MKSLNFSFWLLVFVVIFASLPNPIYALDFRTGSDIYLNDESGLAENVYIASGRTELNTRIDGDVSLISSDANIKGIIEKDLTLAGGNVNIEGEIKGDMRIVGGNVSIKGIIDGDVVVVGGDVKIEENAQIKGEVLIIGGRVEILGSINQYAKVLSGHIFLNNKLNGTGEFTTQKLVLGDKAEINGTLKYFSPEKAQEDVNTKFNGDVHFNQISSFQDSNIFKKVVLSFINFWILLRFITTLLLAFLLVYVFKVFSQRVNDIAIERFGSSLLTGVLSLILIPVCSVILFVSLIGLPLSIILVLVLIFILTISSAVAGIILGTLIQKVLKKKDHVEVSFQNATVGVILLTVLQFVPFIGELTRVIFFFLAVGSIILYMYQNIRFKKIF